MKNATENLRRLVIFASVAAISLGAAACGDDDSNDQQANSNNGANTGNTGATGATGATGTTGTAPASAGAAAASNSTSNAAVDSIRFFATNSPWNTRADGLPIAANSARMIQLAVQRIAVREVPGRDGVFTFIRKRPEALTVNTEAWAPLVVSAGGDGAEMTNMVCRQSDCGPSDPKVPSQLALPPGTTPDPRYDGWLSVIDPERGVGYDFWRARRQDSNTISFQFSKGWTLDGPGFSQPVSEAPLRAPGARGSGLPLFAGLISPGELTAGRIDHALAISLPGIARRNFVQPASVTNGIGDRKSLPAGARVRLRDGVGIRNSPRDFKGVRSRSVETILTALREYGAIVVDRSAVPTLFAPRGTSRRLVRGNELDWLTVDDFEAVQLPPIFKDPPLAEIALEGPAAQSEGTVQSGQAAGSGQ